MNHLPEQTKASTSNEKSEVIEENNAHKAFFKKCKAALGIGLPPRTIPLNLTIPTPSERVSVSHASSHDLKQLEDTPLEYMELLRERIKYMNQVKFSRRRRHRINNELVALFYPMAVAQMARHTRNGGIPEAEDRGKLLTGIADIAGILSTSHLMLFAACYEAGNFHYARQRSRLYLWASRIFELSLLKQRCCGLRHQSLDATDWKVINTLFYVMALYEEVHLPQASLKQQLKMSGKSTAKTIADHFITLHMHAWLDLLCWPTHLHWLISKYLHSVPNAVSAGIETIADSEFNLVSSCYSKFPANRKVHGGPPEYPIFMHIKTLVLAMAQDIFPLMNSAPPKGGPASSNKFKSLPIADQFILRNQFVSQLKFEEATVDTSMAHNFDDFRIYVGFAEIFALLRHRQSRSASEARLSDWLAKRSASIAHDETSEDATTWFFLFQRGDLMRLSTDELNNSNAMNIGSLLAYGVGDEIHRPKLGVVSRIQRSSHQNVQIDIRFIAAYAEAVIITFNSSGVTAKMSAVLIFNPHGTPTWQIICPPLRNLDNMRQFTLHRKSLPIAAASRELISATSEYFILGTNLTSAALHIEKDPKYPALHQPPGQSMPAIRIGAF